MDSIAALEQRLARDLGRRHCIAFGRGATAIWLVLEALGERSAARKVVLPATLCTSPVAVTRLAGFTPLFCDVEVLSGNINPAALARLLAEHEDIACVIAAHLYGTPARIEEIAELCARHGVALIEDAAQAVGAEVGGRLAGAFGDVSIISFGHTKILNAGGGGAALTNDAALAERLKALADALPPPPDELDAWSQEYRQAYYSLVPRIKSGAVSPELVGELCLRHPQTYRYALTADIATRIDQALNGLTSERDHRRAMATVYRTELAAAPVTLMAENGGAVPWRFNVLIPDGRRNSVADALRSAGFDASPWYPVVAPFFENAPNYKQRWPNAATLEDEILNLWVDDSIDETRIRGLCAVIKDCL